MLALASCARHSDGDVPVASSAPARSIDRLDLLTASPNSALSPQEQSAFEAWLDIVGKDYSRAEYAVSAPVAAFVPEIRRSLPPLDSVEQVLGHALQGADSISLYAVASPYSQAVVTHPDGYVFIALNHYLGPDSPVYAGRFAAYERRRKTLSRLPADVMEALTVGRHPAELDSRSTLLNNMLYRGAVLQNVLESMPEGTPEATILAMTPEEYAWCVGNEANIWRSIIGQDMLYSTDQTLIHRLLQPAPSSPAISADAPGQTALFAALKIVQSYLRAHPSAKASQLLSPAFYNSNQSLIDSNYTPANANQ